MKTCGTDKLTELNASYNISLETKKFKIDKNFTDLLDLIKQNQELNQHRDLLTNN